jgi:hypothetical protein
MAYVANHATGDPLSFILTPLAMPGAAIADVLTGGQEIHASNAPAMLSTMPTYTGPGGNYSTVGTRPSSGGGCGPYRNLAQQCYSSWQGLGGGFTGQAGSEHDCYVMYSNLARSC